MKSRFRPTTDMGKIKFYFDEVTTTLGSLTEQEKWDLPPETKIERRRASDSHADHLWRKLVFMTCWGIVVMLIFWGVSIVYGKLIH